jgi:hypothetical protein
VFFWATAETPITQIKSRIMVLRIGTSELSDDG